MARSQHYKPRGIWETVRRGRKYEFVDIYPSREILGRRNWVRRVRYPDTSPRRYYGQPPSSMQKIWRKQARAAQKQEFLRTPDDPVLTPISRLIRGYDRYW